jgi:DNA polymerase-3 subunit beta
MDIVARKADLLRELQLVQGIVERKNSIPILSNVLLEAEGESLAVAATDLDVSLRCSCPAQVARPGATTLSAKKLYEVVRALPDSDVHLRVESDGWASLECERSHFRMAGLPREDFPSLPEAAGGSAIEIPGSVLRDLIARTSFAITAEDARYYLAGALLVLARDGVALVATDGHRLAYARRSAKLKLGGEGLRVLVPRKAVGELQQLLQDGPVSFQQAGNHLVFSVGGRVLASKMIEGQFPAYEKVVELKGDKVALLDREALAAAVRRVSLLSAERSRAVRVGLQDGRLELSASSPEMGEARESLPTEYHGAAVEIGFNAQYLLDFLSSAGTSQVSLELRDQESQGMLRPVAEGEGESTDHRYVVMPMRL